MLIFGLVGSRGNVCSMWGITVAVGHSVIEKEIKLGLKLDGERHDRI